MEQICPNCENGDISLMDNFCKNCGYKLNTGSLKQTIFSKFVLGKRLRVLRESRNLTMGQLASDIGLKSKGAISQYEKGINSPSLDSLFLLAEYFQVSIDYLTGRVNSPGILSATELELENNRLKEKLEGILEIIKK